MKGQKKRRSRHIVLLLLFDRWGWVVNTTPWLLYSQEGEIMKTQINEYHMRINILIWT
jgi:hypothetical protein